MGFRRVVFALAMTGFGISAAEAAPNHGWYATVEAGANRSSAEGRVTNLPFSGLLNLDVFNIPAHPRVDLDTGWAGFAAVCLELGAHFRIEGELGYRSNAAASDERVGQKTLMINGLLALPLLDNLTLSAGAGLGADQVSWSDLEPFEEGRRDQTVFAYQGLVGLNMDLTDRIGLFARYRYLDASSVDMRGLFVKWNNYTTIGIQGDDLRSQTVTVGVQFAL